MTYWEWLQVVMRSDMRRIIGDQRGTRKGFARKGWGFDSAELRKISWDAATYEWDDSLLASGKIGGAAEGRYTGRPRYPRSFSSKLIERFLARQVGRHFDDIWSEMVKEVGWARGIDPGQFKHLVALQVNGEGPLTLQGYSSGRQILASDPRAPKYFVNALTGILHRNTEIVTDRMRRLRLAAEVAQQTSIRLRVLGPTRQLHLLSDGNWWNVTLRQIDHREQIDVVSLDVLLRSGLTTLPRRILYGRDDVIAIRYRPLSAKELRKFRLR
jgi:hypothetical protein